MSNQKSYNLNKYTIIEKGNIDKIHFYIESAMLDKDIKKNNSLHVTFEIKKEKEDKVYDMHIFLINKNRETVYRSYSIYLKQIDENYYAILKNKSDIKHAEILPSSTINFNTLDFSSFKKLLSTSEEFTNMIPELTKSLKDYKEEMNDEKEAALTIDIPTPINYYHNVVGNAIITFEEIIATEEEQDITNKILNLAKKNFEVVMTNDYDKILSLINLEAYALFKAKSESLIPQDILKDSELKTDTNKEELELEELLNTLKNFIYDEDPNKDNIISERIHYILEEKPRLDEITNYVKIILAADKYINKKRRVRAVSEFDLKELLIKSFIDETYLPLPRNEVLVYHLDNNVVDFIVVISLDLIIKLFNTYKLNAAGDNEKSCLLYNDVNRLINNKNITKESYVVILIEIISMMYLYYLKNINQKSLLFNRGELIINLDYYKGNYDIKIINKNTKKEFGKFIKLNEVATKEIKESLDKGERYFTEYMNYIVYNNLYNALMNQSLTIEMKSLTHKGIKYILRRPVKENIFECNFPIQSIISLLISPNKPRAVREKEVEEVDTHYIYNIPISDYEYIVRKADTISKIMENSPINNKDYVQIVKYYEKLRNAKDDQKKTEILLKLAELFKIEITDIKKEDNE